MLRLIVIILITTLMTASVNSAGLSKIAILNDAAEALGTVAESFEKVVDSISHAVQTGDTAINVLQLRRTKQQLITVYKTGAFLRLTNVGIIEDLKRFAKDNERVDRFRWEELKEAIRVALSTGTEIIGDLKQMDSDFVIDDSYSLLLASLYTRSSIIEDILGLEAPDSEEEWEALRELVFAWGHAVGRMKQANDKMAE